MLKCVDCGYEAEEFQAVVAGISEGAITYKARCPKCGSFKVKHTPGYHEKDLRISIKEKW